MPNQTFVKCSLAGCQHKNIAAFDNFIGMINIIFWAKVVGLLCLRLYCYNMYQEQNGLVDPT